MAPVLHKKNIFILHYSHIYNTQKGDAMKCMELFNALTKNVNPAQQNLYIVRPPAMNQHPKVYS